MRTWLILLALLARPVTAQVQNWNAEPYMADGSIRFHDDLDFFLNGYTKDELRTMRREVQVWRMNFDQMMRATIKDIQLYSEGGNMVPRTHDFTLPEVRTHRPYELAAHKGKLRVFMFASISNPPARAQLPFWGKLLAKYDTSQVEFFVIYGRELHPGDKKQYGKYPLPATMAEKLGYAQALAQLTELPVLVDGLDDKTFTDYGRVPNGAYVIDRAGRLIFRGTWADSRKIEHIVDSVLKWEAEGKPQLKPQP
ncbi:MAG: hypothetical protein KBH07_06050 [Flavobacteriales bacterium]|nr:hypothetical protein [Flavobacteriales bacterium]MBP9079394.1 hypothetical protein [Flavobacteriales bacterium]